MHLPPTQDPNNRKKNVLWQTLILQNCWPVSQPAKYSNKKMTQYLLGSRASMNVFKYDHLRHLLLKMSPFFRSLFQSHVKIQNKVGRYIYYVPPTPPRDPKKLVDWQKRIKDLKTTRFKKKWHYYKIIEKAKPIKVLFATTNPIYSEIIASAANLCQMSFHTHRWLCGALTANARYVKDRIQAEYAKEEKDPIANVHFQFLKKFHKNKEVPEKRYGWYQFQKKSKRPTIAIIPDIHNNDMILRETQPLQIPVIGLVNSSCATQITYPIFGNANSLEIVHFFCHFLAVLIAKEVSQQDYKKTSHRIFARTRWGFQKDRHIMPYKVFKDRQTKISPRWSMRFPQKIQKLKPIQRMKTTKKIKKMANKWKSWLNLAQKKRIKQRRQKIKQRRWLSATKISVLKLKKIKKIKKKKNPIQTDHLSQKKGFFPKFSRKQKRIKKKRRGILAISKKLIYQKYLPRMKKIFGRRFYYKKQFRKGRKFVNNVTGHRYFVQKNVVHVMFKEKFYPSMKNWRARAWSTFQLTLELQHIFKQAYLHKKKISNFFRNYSALTYLAYHYFWPQLTKKPRTRWRDSRKIRFFEFYLNQKKNLSLPFSLPAWKQELLTTHESNWRNAYWTYFRTQKTIKRKKRLKAFSRLRFWNSKKIFWKNRKFKGKVRFARINKPYHWRSTLVLLTKHQIKDFTKLWLQTRRRIYKDIQREFLKDVAWYFDKKKRKKFWKQLVLFKRIKRLRRRLKFKPKFQRYKPRWKKHWHPKWNAYNHKPWNPNHKSWNPNHKSWNPNHKPWNQNHKSWNPNHKSWNQNPNKTQPNWSETRFPIRNDSEKIQQQKTKKSKKT